MSPNHNLGSATHAEGNTEPETSQSHEIVPSEKSINPPPTGALDMVEEQTSFQEEDFRTDPLYRTEPDPDGYYSCPFIGCTKKRTEEKSQYKKHLDRHIRPYRCNHPECPFHQIGYAVFNALQEHIRCGHTAGQKRRADTGQTNTKRRKKLEQGGPTPSITKKLRDISHTPQPPEEVIGEPNEQHAHSFYPKSDSVLPQGPRACDLCRVRKAKCDRQFPCARCARMGQKCEYKHITQWLNNLKKVAPKIGEPTRESGKYVQGLKEKLQSIISALDTETAIDTILMMMLPINLHSVIQSTHPDPKMPTPCANVEEVPGTSTSGISGFKPSATQGQRDGILRATTLSNERHINTTFFIPYMLSNATGRVYIVISLPESIFNRLQTKTILEAIHFLSIFAWDKSYTRTEVKGEAKQLLEGFKQWCTQVLPHLHTACPGRSFIQIMSRYLNEFKSPLGQLYRLYGVKGVELLALADQKLIPVRCNFIAELADQFKCM